jgi:hypothetical protein
VFVTMRGADRDTVTSFEQAVNGIAQTIHAQRLFGEPEYLLQVLAADLPASSSPTTPNSPPLPGVQNSPRPS